MKKIRNFFEKNVNDVKKSIKNYPGSYLLTIIMTLFYMVVVDNVLFDNNKIINTENIFMFYGTTVLAVLLTEILFSKIIYRIIGYAVSFVIGTLFQLMSHEVIKFFGKERLLIAYVFIMAFLIFFFIIRKLKVNSHKYLLDLFNNMFFNNLVYLIVNFSLTAVVGIFVYLIIEGEQGEVITRLQVLLFGGLFLNSLIYAVSKQKSNITVFIKNIIKFVLYPVTIIAILIIYIYLFKILVLVKTPANEIFRIVTGIFAVGYPIVLMIRNYKDDNKFYNISVKVVPWLYIPLILLQVYALILRVAQYGCTGMRYIGFFVIAMEIVILVLSLYKKKDMLEFSLLVAVVLTLIAVVSPFNYVKIGVISQANRLKKLMPVGTEYKDLSTKDKEKAYEIGCYLAYEEEIYTDKYVPKYLKQILEDCKFNYYDTEDVVEDKKLDEYVNITYSNGRRSVDIKKYDRMTKFSKEDNYIDNKYQNMYVDLLLELYEENDGNVEEALDKDNIIEDFSYDGDMCILELDVTYIVDEKKDEVKVDCYSISGMNLE